MVLMVLLAAALAQQPVPQPFPRPDSAPPSKPSAPAPARPAPPPPAAPEPQAERAAGSPQAADTPTQESLGVAVYPGAQFLTSYDAGRGQRFYLFGSTVPFEALVTYYRTVLRTRGEMVFDTPATYQFDVGRFREESMAFPPSVTLKDFQSAISKGYPNPQPGAEPTHFPTLIQIVPPPQDATR